MLDADGLAEAFKPHTSKQCNTMEKIREDITEGIKTTRLGSHVSHVFPPETEGCINVSPVTVASQRKTGRSWPLPKYLVRTSSMGEQSESVSGR